MSGTLSDLVDPQVAANNSGVDLAAIKEWQSSGLLPTCAEGKVSTELVKVLAQTKKTKEALDQAKKEAESILEATKQISNELRSLPIAEASRRNSRMEGVSLIIAVLTLLVAFLSVVIAKGALNRSIDSIRAQTKATQVSTELEIQTRLTSLMTRMFNLAGSMPASQGQYQLMTTEFEDLLWFTEQQARDDPFSATLGSQPQEERRAETDHGNDPAQTIIDQGGSWLPSIWSSSDARPELTGVSKAFWANLKVQVCSQVVSGISKQPDCTKGIAVYPSQIADLLPVTARLCFNYIESSETNGQGTETIEESICLEESEKAQ